jgi:dephospho-CoA kinase
MYIIGLTGGPGAGKTEVADILRKNRAVIISGDDIGREVVNTNPAVLKKLVKTFSEEILFPDKKLNRAKLGMLVFGNHDNMQKLNEIIHPPLLKLLKSKIKISRDKYPKKLIVVDAALIFEWGIANWFDYILVVTAKRDFRIKRLVKNGLSNRQAQARIASQIPQKTKANLADFIIENNGTKPSLNNKVTIFLTSIRSISSGNQKK